MTVTAAYKNLLAVPTRPKKPHLLEPRKKPNNKVFLSADARIGSFAILSQSGGGKSVMLGRHFAFNDAKRGLPQLIIDVSGQCIENFLHACLFLKPARQKELLDRVIYCNMAGQDGFVPSFPMLLPKRLDEPLAVTAARLPTLLGQLDENFSKATIQGLTRTIPIASNVGKILTALGLPLAHAHDLLRSPPELWADRIQEAAATDPEAALAAEELFEFMSLDTRTREDRVNALLNRLYILRDNINRAMLSSTRPPTVDYERASFYGETILISLDQEKNPFAKQFKLQMIFNDALEYFESRGRRAKLPFGLVIDELTHFTRNAALNIQAIEEKLLMLLEVIARNNMLYVTLATQNVRQLTEELQRAVLNLKSHPFGTVTDFDTALELARRYYEMDPYRVKYWKRVWGSDNFLGKSQYYVIDHEPEFMPLTEQEYLNNRNFTNLRKGEWLFAESTGEGEHAKSVRKITTPHLYKPPFPSDNQELLDKLRSYLARRDGEPIAEILAEIEDDRLYEIPAPYTPQKQRRHRQAAPARTPKAVGTVSPNGKERARSPLTVTKQPAPPETPTVNGQTTTHQPPLTEPIEPDGQTGSRFGELPED